MRKKEEKYLVKIVNVKQKEINKMLLENQVMMNKKHQVEYKEYRRVIIYIGNDDVIVEGFDNLKEFKMYTKKVDNWLEKIK